MEDALGLTAAISALASAVACRIEEDEELELLAAMVVQLGDTLETIAAQRAREKACRRVASGEKGRSGT